MRRDRVLLCVILPLACFVRLYGIDFGLPHTECRPDESTLVFKALSFFSGDLNPHFFNYPTLYMYALFGLYGLYFLFRFSFGSSTADMLTEVAVSPANFFLVSRVFSALLGSLTVAAVYCIAGRMFDRKTARFSALLMGICYLHVRDSHFGTTDVTMTFFVVCAVFFIARCYESGHAHDYCLAGAFAGLATSTKYGGIFLAVPMLCAHFLRPCGHMHAMGVCGPDCGHVIIPSPVKSRRTLPSIFSFVACVAGWKLLATYFLSGAILFLMFTPFALFDFSQFTAGVAFEVRHLAAGHGELLLGRGWSYHLVHTLPYGMGWSLLLASLIGIVMHSRENVTKAVVLYAFPLVYYVSVGRGYTVFVRYMIPILPFLCISAAIFAIRLSDLVAKRLPRKAMIQHAAPVLVVLAISAPSIHNIFLFDSTISKIDSRVLAADWINANLPAGSTLYHTGAVWGQAQPTPALETLERALEEARRMGTKGRVLKARIDIYRKEARRDGYREWKYEAQEPIGQSSLPDYVVAYRSPLVEYSKVPDQIEELLKRDYHLLQAFEPISVDATQNWYDQLDAFYLPLVGFEGVERPGPNIYIYERNTHE